MGIYSNKSMMSGGYSDIDIWSPCEQEIRCEGVDINFHEAALMAVAESERVYNNAMKEIGIAELHYLEENGQEMIYEAVDVHGALEKIKKFFVKLIDKVKALFHAFVTKMSSIFSDNKDFATKYKKEFFKKWNDVKSDFEFKGYKFTVGENSGSRSAIGNMQIGDVTSTLYPTAVQTALGNSDGLKPVVDALNGGTSIDYTTDKANHANLKKDVETLKDNEEEMREAIRGYVASKYSSTFGGSTVAITAKTMDSTEFNQELFEAFRNKESSKESLELKKEFSSAKIISDIENSNKIVKDAQKATDETVKILKNDIKALEKVEKELGKKLSDAEQKDDEIVNYRSEALSAVVTVDGLTGFMRECIISANGIYMQALKDKCSQDKAIVAKVIAGGKKMQRESYDYYEDNNYTGSYLDTVVIR